MIDEYNNAANIRKKIVNTTKIKKNYFIILLSPHCHFATLRSLCFEIMGSVLLIILPTFELLQTKHQLVLTVVGFLPPKRA